MEMLRPHRRYMRRTFQTGLWLQYRTSAHQVQLHAKINKLQIDNQLSECVFPVILAPVPLPKSVTQSTGIYPFNARNNFFYCTAYDMHFNFSHYILMKMQCPECFKNFFFLIFFYFCFCSHETFRGTQYGQASVGAQHRATVPIFQGSHTRVSH